MNKKTAMVIGLTRVGTDNVQRLSFAQTTFDDIGLEKDRKIGFLQIDPDKDAYKVLEAASQREWHFGAFNRQSQTYAVVAGPAPATIGEGELVTEKGEAQEA